MSNDAMIDPSYVFIGDLKRKVIMTEYSSGQSIKQHHDDAKSIFDRFCKSTAYNLNQRNQIKANADGDYFFIITDPSLFFLVYAQSRFPQTQIFKMIDNIIQEHIPLMTNDKGELNAQGRQALKVVITKWQKDDSCNKTSEIQEAMNSIRIDMKDNIDKVVKNMNDLDDLQDKSNKMKETSESYKKDANTLQKLTWYKNVKLLVLIVFLIIVLLLVIILPIVLKK